LPPALEHFDDDHASTAAWAWRPDVGRFVVRLVRGRRGSVEELARTSDARPSRTAGEQAVMPDAVEATRQDMEQETADELVDRERHDLLPIAAVTAVILVAEGDVRFVERDQATVRDGDPVRVARQIGKHGFRPRKGRLGIDDPALPADWRQVSYKCTAISQRRSRTEDGEPPGIVELEQPCQEQASE